MNRTVLLSVAAVCVLSPEVPLVSQSRPLPDQRTFLEEVRQNLARSDSEQYRYAYQERRSELHTNPFGRLGTGGTLLYEVKPGEALGVYHRQLVARDGQAVSDQKPSTVDRRGRSDTNPSVSDVVDTLEFEMVGREVVDGRELIAVKFGPREKARPQTRPGKIAKVFRGTFWIDEAAREVTRVEAVAVDSLSYGLGLVARLSEGTEVELVREPVDDSLWLPVSIKLKGEGRALFFIRKLEVDFFVEWFDYQRVLAE